MAKIVRFQICTEWFYIRMMNANAYLQEGRLRQAIAVQQQVVEACSTDWAARFFLCDLLLARGDLEQVRSHLQQFVDPSLAEYTVGYQALLDAEVNRRRFRLSEAGSLPSHASWRWKGIQQSGRKAQSAIDRADQQSPFLSGHIDGREFEGLRDGDDRFASVLEVIVDGEYRWFGWESLRRVRLEVRQSLRDELFQPALLTTSTGETLEVLLPSLYPYSHEHSDEIALGIETDWIRNEDGPIQGIGLRVWNVGEEEVTLKDFTQIDLRS